MSSPLPLPVLVTLLVAVLIIATTINFRSRW